ncbi:MAG: hydroxymethylbilane synthase, partial [Burkholderiales bacterium]
MSSASSPSSSRLVIATRESALALVQARHIRARLRELYPAMTVELLGMTTTGDRELGGPLATIGGKGLFIKELEEALADGRADLAVHSMKDMPVQLLPGFTLAAITAREDPRDAFVSRRWRTLADLPAGSCVGTSSLRRSSQVLAKRPDLRIEALRGNVQTRLRKLDEGAYDAIILAVAGLKRLGLADRITSALEPEESLPAAGQGALGLECLSDRADVAALLAPLADASATACVRAERALANGLGGNCQMPVGAFAVATGSALRLRAFV